MTQRAKIDGEAIAQYPYYLHDLRRDNPSTSLPDGAWPSDLEYFGVVEVAESVAPTPSATQELIEVAPALIEGAWMRQWALRDWTAGEIAAHDAELADAARRASIDADVSADGPLAMIRKASPEQIDNYIDANVTTLLQARTFLKRLTKLVVSQMRQ